MNAASLSTAPGRRAWLALAGGLLALFLFMLGTRGLNEPDEGRYANIALAMVPPGGDWWEPRMSGYGHYDKPPLIYWTTALSFRAFGVNAWAARLPSLLGAVLALGGLGWAAYRLRGAWVAWWAVLICGASVQFWVFVHILSPDMLLTGWCTLAVAAWAEARHRAGSWGWWSLSLACWTLAWWTKATPALIPLAGLIAGVLITRDGPGRRALRPGLLLPAVLALGSPWYVSMLLRYPELSHFFFGRELAGRLAGQASGRHGWPGYYVPVSLVAWLPWWPVAVWAGWQARARLRAGSWRTLSAAWAHRLGVEGWILATGLVILSLVSSKLAGYTLTLAPWAALLMARALAGVVGSPDGAWPRVSLWPAGVFAAVAVAGIVVLPNRWESRLRQNSSLRQVSDFLRRQGAGRVDSDRYWPGLEFYLGQDTVHYVIHGEEPSPSDDPDPAKPTAASRVDRYRERASDPGAPPNRFITSEQWPTLPPDAVSPPGGGWWFIHYHRFEKRVLTRALQDENPARRPVRVTRIGDFDLYRVPPSP